MDRQDINGLEFVKARSEEINRIEASIENNKKKKLLFQRLPFHKRRRTANRDTRRLPKTHRKILLKKSKTKKRKRILNNNLLKTHIWHSKRFRMISLWNTKLPYKRNEKSCKFIYKSYSRGFVFDESFLKVLVFEKPNNCHLQVNHEMLNVIQNVDIVNFNILVKVLLTENFLIIICHEVEGIIEFFKSQFKYLFSFSNLVSFIKGENKFNESGEYLKSEMVCDNIDDFIERCYQSIENENVKIKSCVFVKSLDALEKGKFFLFESGMMDLWENLIKNGVIPICIEEILRLSIENRKFLYPFDYPESYLYKQYEKCIMQPIIEKYERTPPSKKVNYKNIEYPFNLPIVDRNIKKYFFMAEKGALDRFAIIYCKEIVFGYVIRAQFSFSMGKCSGLCFLYETADLNEKYQAKNKNSEILYEIKFI